MFKFSETFIQALRDTLPGVEKLNRYTSTVALHMEEEHNLTLEDFDDKLSAIINPIQEECGVNMPFILEALTTPIAQVLANSIHEDTNPGHVEDYLRDFLATIMHDVFAAVYAKMHPNIPPEQLDEIIDGILRNPAPHTQH